MIIYYDFPIILLNLCVFLFSRHVHSRKMFMKFNFCFAFFSFCSDFKNFCDIHGISNLFSAERGDDKRYSTSSNCTTFWWFSYIVPCVTFSSSNFGSRFAVWEKPNNSRSFDEQICNNCNDRNRRFSCINWNHSIDSTDLETETTKMM